jgi:hypothetical protein
MAFRLVTAALGYAALAGAAVLVLAAPAAGGDFRLFRQPCPCPSVPPPWCPPEAMPAPAVTPAPTPAAPAPAPAPAEQPPAAAVEPPSLPEQAFGAERGGQFALAIPSMQGHQLGIPALSFGRRGNPRFPPPPGQGPVGGVVVPTIRSFKIAENESPRPRDRVYFGFNYYNHVNDAVNRRLGADVSNIHVYRETFGLEKTLLDGDASIGLRLPLNTLSADSGIPGLGGSSTDWGDLTVILKYTLWQNPATGSLLSAGLAVTTPTGPDAFAGSGAITSFHYTTLQPYAGYIWSGERWFLHGFWALDIPTNSEDVTLMYNDVGVGYFLYRDGWEGRGLTAIVPTFEVHVNTPLNHRGAFDFTDPAGTPDWVELTTGVTFEFNQRSTFAVGFVTPVTGPRPYDFEVLAQLNVRF